MYDFGSTSGQIARLETPREQISNTPDFYFDICKRAFDILICLFLLPLLCTAALALMMVNRSVNPGPLLFVQPRMGKHCVPFLAYKFRSMTPATRQRQADEPLEHDRITVLGAFLRQSRIDELPQIINVLRGEMSLIGPRPDCYQHAETYLNVVPGYEERHSVLPGISGFAQTEIGYVEGADETARKVQADLHYIANRSIRFELWIFWRTLITIISRSGR
ncbi:sugar transferase [Aliiroseovarius sp. 2305UL8-7]|uniref:sugar transferase n=1 Tax=Aliiroseovarius conchicola TaxID=3121637 RepID=UPI00352906AF